MLSLAHWQHAAIGILTAILGLMAWFLLPDTLGQIGKGVLFFLILWNLLAAQAHLAIHVHKFNWIMDTGAPKVDKDEQKWRKLLEKKQ